MLETNHEEMKRYFAATISFVERISAKFNKLNNSMIEKDIEALATGTILPEKFRKVNAFTYDFSENDKKSLKDILIRSVSSTVTLSSNDLKADLYQLQALIFRLNLKIDKDIFDLESLKMNPNELIKILKKAEKKYLNKIKNDSIKKAIEVLEKDNKEVITENIHSLVPDIQKEDIDRYLKRLDSVKKARAKNSKVLGSES